MNTVSSSGDMLDVVAGRHESNPPAAAFSVGLSVANILGLKAPISTIPKDLNFVVSG